MSVLNFFSNDSLINKVDIVIPSKDRPIQLHLLLESMNKYLRGIGRITITCQSTTDDFQQGYDLLKKRVLKNTTFNDLRNNSNEIVFRKRNSLREVYKAFMDSGDSDYIMVLIDDDVFIRDYDLTNDSASKYLFQHKEVLACSIRLGDNLSDQVFYTTDDGIFTDVPRGHANSLLLSGKPRFISPKLGYETSKLIANSYYEQDYLLWEWPSNLNVPHWSCIFSTTSHIYRKSIYLEMIKKFGRENFQVIEGKGFKYYKCILFKKYSILINIVKALDKFQMAISGKYFNFGSYEVFEVLLYKLLQRKNSWINETVPYLMVAPRKSVVAIMDYKTSHNRNIDIDKTNTLNSFYLSGKIINLNDISYDMIFSPWQIYKDRKFVNYNK